MVGFADLFGDPEPEGIEPVDVRAEHVRKIEDALLAEALETTRDGLAFADIDPANPGAIPESWKAELGDDSKRLSRRHRVASMSCLPSKDAPVGIANAGKVAIGILRSRATEKTAGPRVLNVAVMMPLPPRDYPELEAPGEENR